MLPVALWDAVKNRPLERASDLLVVAVKTPHTSLRAAARQQVREVMQRLLGQYLARPPASLDLVFLPGQAPQMIGEPDLGLSISHAEGLSLLAIHRHGPVGIDLQAWPSTAGLSAEIDALCRDYLAQPVAGKTPAERQDNFIRAWTAHEAALKCLGLPLAESTPARHAALARCTCQPLDLPAGYIGSLARKI